jgi:hypothetical protein
MYVFDIQAIRKKSIGYLPATGKEMSLQSAAEEKRLREDDMEASLLSYFGHWQRYTLR